MKKIYVDKKTEINTIQKAFNLIDENDENEIYIGEGTYFEKLKLTKSNVSLIGVSKEKTIISNNDFALKIHQDGKEFNTFRTYTLMILANNVKIRNITVENTSGSGEKFGQSVALSVIGNDITISECYLKSYQDTLFLGPLPKDLIIRYQNFLPSDELIYLKEKKVNIYNTIIVGDVDYIFGSANALFDECTFISLKRDGFVFAPSTEKEDEEGFIISRCKFEGLSSYNNSYLARPWRDYGKVVIIDSIFNNHIKDVGFDKWNDSNRDLTCRFYEYNNKYLDNHQYFRCNFSKDLNDKEINKYLKIIEKRKKYYCL